MRADLTRVCGLSKPTVGLGLANLERDGLVRLAGRRTGDEGHRPSLYEVNPDGRLRPGRGRGPGVRPGRAGRPGRHGPCPGQPQRSCGQEPWPRVRADRPGGGAGGASPVCPRSWSPTWSWAALAFTTERRDALSPGRTACLAGATAAVVAELRRAFGPNMVLENDVNLAALAERDHGHGREVDTFAFVSVGTGIGMGLVLGRQLAQGRPRRRRRDRFPPHRGAKVRSTSPMPAAGAH